MEQNLRIADLITAYLQQRLNPDEEKELSDWLEASAENREIFRQIVNEKKLGADLATIKSFDAATALQKIKQFPQLPARDKVIFIRWPRIAAAASILLVLSFGGYFLLHKTKPIQPLAQNQIHDIAPGGNKATLTLSDGKKIILTDAKYGTIASQGHTLIRKANDGQILYNTANAGKANGGATMLYNTLTTNRGEQYKVVLPDGSKAWLNAASSLRYPVAFNGKERVVELTGEAYFEVVHNSAQPFRVRSRGQVVEDLGTHFDVNAYDDEPAMITTLLQGKVNVTDDGYSRVLYPGQQAVAAANAKLKVFADVDAEEVTAWKDGRFVFDNANIQTIMRQIARWYNVEIVYEGDVADRFFTGDISRNTNLSELLKALELSNIHFKLEGRKLIVRK